MSSQTLTNWNITDELRRSYKAVLLQIARNLEKDQKEDLRFYFDGTTPTEPCGFLNFLRSLEYAVKISWSDLSLLKEGLCAIGRLDLEETLTAFEIKRDLITFFCSYARKRQELELFCRPALESAEKVAGYLVKVMTEMVQDRFDVSNAVRSLLESSKSVRKVLVDFEEEIEHEPTDAWSKLTSLVAISGEVIAEALVNEQHHQWPKLCFTVAEELCSRMMRLGFWVRCIYSLLL